MIHHVKHPLKVEEADGATKVRKRQGKKAAESATAKPVKAAAVKTEAASYVPEADKPTKAASAAKPAPKKASAKKKESDNFSIRGLYPSPSRRDSPFCI